jgi:hypothetical protein
MTLRADNEDSMKKQPFALWFRTVSGILILFGILYEFVGLKVLPVQRNVLLDWESALYGAVMIGWGTMHDQRAECPLSFSPPHAGQSSLAYALWLLARMPGVLEKGGTRCR